MEGMSSLSRSSKYHSRRRNARRLHGPVCRNCRDLQLLGQVLWDYSRPTCQTFLLDPACPCCRFLANDEITYETSCESKLIRTPPLMISYQISSKHQQQMSLVLFDSYWIERTEISPRFHDFQKLRAIILDCLNAGRCSLDHVCCYQRAEKSIDVPLRVIDCREGTVVEPPKGCHYLALSYVWGQKQNDSHDYQLERAPASIKDAITLTQSLGFQYLWVDKYCINQSNKEEINEQVNKMNIIYQNATATIIDAAGSDPYSGLFGFSLDRTIYQAEFKSDDFNLTRVPHLFEAVNQSPWMLRAWTFQEALFSARRIYITKIGIMYDCKTRIFHEWDSFSGDENTYFDQENDRRTTDKFKNWSSCADEENIDRLIRQYAIRELSYPNDILRAFAGVFAEMRKRSPEMRNYWGIPLESTIHRGDIHQPEFLARICWSSRGWNENISTCKRRIGFPSWSWCGWIKPSLPNKDATRILKPIGGIYLPAPIWTSIAFGLRTGGYISSFDLNDRLERDTDLDSLSPNLLLTTWIQPLEEYMQKHNNQIYEFEGLFGYETLLYCNRSAHEFENYRSKWVEVLDIPFIAILWLGHDEHDHERCDKREYRKEHLGFFGFIIAPVGEEPWRSRDWDRWNDESQKSDTISNADDKKSRQKISWDEYLQEDHLWERIGYIYVNGREVVRVLPDAPKWRAEDPTEFMYTVGAKLHTIRLG